MNNPICKWEHYDCVAIRGKKCMALNDVDFPRRKDCPFYRSDEEPPVYERGKKR